MAWYVRSCKRNGKLELLDSDWWRLVPNLMQGLQTTDRWFESLQNGVLILRLSGTYMDDHCKCVRILMAGISKVVYSKPQRPSLYFRNNSLYRGPYWKIRKRFNKQKPSIITNHGNKKPKSRHHTRTMRTKHTTAPIANISKFQAIYCWILVCGSLSESLATVTQCVSHMATRMLPCPYTCIKLIKDLSER